MKEDLLHHLWKFRNLGSLIQYTSAGQRVEIIHPGLHNHDSGPDFFNARVRIDNLEWAGNVEIHVKSSDWVLHGHSSDRAYDSVILHVVYEDDSPKMLRDSSFPTLQLKGQIDPSIVHKYESLFNNPSFIPCARVIAVKDIDKILIINYIERLYIEKLEGKFQLITDLLAASNKDWDEAFYQLLARSFGLGKNKLPFELLARTLPLSIVKREMDTIESVEALFFGQAGFLTIPPTDEYMARLKLLYQGFQQNYGLQPIDAHLWKFSRLRPGNFPTRRIAQFAALLHKGLLKFKHFIEAEDLSYYYNVFDLQASDYWADHSKFGRKVIRHSTRLGKETVDSILINAIVPIMFAYGRLSHRVELEKRAMELIGQLGGEINSITEGWSNLGFDIPSALESQAFLYLKKEYCDHKKCLSCAIGTTILGKSE